MTERYPTIAAVGAGSVRAPEVVVLEWRGSTASEHAQLVSLCGKGVCFDTGGYDLKPSAGMLRMKKDMGGAAILLGLAQAVMALDLPVRLQLRLGCVENSVSGHAMRPSDMLQTRAGFTVEVGNTDAEGRLVLCDLLAEAADESPDWLIDAATLTGAARVALGPDLPALFCTNDELADIILHAGEPVHDPLWRLPLHERLRYLARQSRCRYEQCLSKADGRCHYCRIVPATFCTETKSPGHISTFMPGTTRTARHDRRVARRRLCAPCSQAIVYPLRLDR